MAAQGQTPKTMSSRLMGMKFMQRSAASPTASKSSDPPSAKRTKLNSGSPHVRRAADQEAFQEIQAQENAKREAILDKLAEEAGDTKWVLQPSAKLSPRLNIVNAGYGAIDGTIASWKELEEDEDYDTPHEGSAEESRSPNGIFSSGIAGRKSFGKFNRQIERRHNPDLTSSSGEENEDKDEDDDSNDESDDNDDGDEWKSSGLKEDDKSKKRKSSSIADDLRAKKKAKRKEEKKTSREQAERRRSKEVKLNRHMTSISSGGSKTTSSKTSQSCFNCGKTGHKAIDCPEPKQHKKHKRHST